MYYFGLEDNFFKLKRKLNFNNTLKKRSQIVFLVDAIKKPYRCGRASKKYF
jgi:hypothetical protein